MKRSISIGKQDPQALAIFRIGTENGATNSAHPASFWHLLKAPPVTSTPRGPDAIDGAVPD